MAVYKNLESLSGKILEPGDQLVFLGIRYIVVRNAFVYYLHDHKNDTIFFTLGIKDKHEFCTEYYGYEPDLRNSHVEFHFPLAMDHDYDALTRVAIALFKLCMN